MKFQYFVLSAAIAMLGTTSYADTTRTQDNVNYLVTIQMDTGSISPSRCVNELRKISESNGSGYIKFYKAIGVAVVNLDSNGVSRAQALPCVTAVELERDDYTTQPRLGSVN